MVGPSDTRSPSRGSRAGGSQTGGSQAPRSRSGSTSKAPTSFPPGLGFDPARNNTAKQEILNGRLDLPADAYVMTQNHTPFARRPGFNKSGKDVQVYINQFRVSAIADHTVQQYDVSISPGGDKRGLIEKVWKSPTLQQKLKTFPGPWIFDGNKLLWSTNKVKELRLTIDLGQELGRAAGKDVIYIIIKHATAIRTNALRSYLEGKLDWDNSILECMNFLDHALRQGPSERMRSFKRTFFPSDAPSMSLNSVTEAIKGIYSSIRMNQSLSQGGSGLGVLVNVSHQTFFIAQAFEQFACEFLRTYDRRWARIGIPEMANLMKPVSLVGKNGHKTWGQSEAFKALKRLVRIKFQVNHRGKSDDTKRYTVKAFAFNPENFPDPSHAKNTFFDAMNRDTGVATRKSVYQHFVDRYNVHLRWWMLPLIETSRGGYFPLEVCFLERYNRYPFKLDPDQTTAMLKFAVQRPPQRRADIMKAVNSIAWQKDPYMKALNIKVDPQMSKVTGKLLRNPEVQYANGKINPGTSGRWDLRGKKFTMPNTVPLKSWSFTVVDNCIDKASLEAFIKTFTQVYQGHGGRIERQPHVFNWPSSQDLGQQTDSSYMSTGRQSSATPQILFFILRDKSSKPYERLKKNMDCRFASLSQMLNVMHVRKASPQYCSNVCMKVNAKLGGQTCRIYSANNAPLFKLPTMMIGCDISHGHVGTDMASVAAMTISMDKDAATYCANVQTNGFRQEILTSSTLNFLLEDLVKYWVKKNGVVPQDVYYMRDGVSEGQFAHVLQHEVHGIRETFRRHFNKAPKITAIVATKRHHVRFFPEQGDKNGNALPGTLVEREVTHPFHYDFYLCSHVAIQGTARPVHYHVIHDEIKPTPDALQNMIYQQCYQYARSTTPVSLHPAVYYAHLACARAIAHEDAASSDQASSVRRQPLTSGGLGAKNDPDALSSERVNDAAPLLPMGGKDTREDAKQIFRHTMWYI